MKKLMVFLHGKGAHKDDPKYKVIYEIAKKRDVEVFAINAPEPHKAGYKWFDKKSGELAPDEIKPITDFVSEKIDDELRIRGFSYSDIIIAGHSQGGFLAMYIALLKGAKEVIALTSSFHQCEMIENANYTDFKLYWIEAGKDSVVSKEAKEGYKLLQNISVEVKYIFSEQSTHDDFDLDIVDII